MNPSGDTIAATLLALLFSGAQLLQESLDLKWPDWSLRDGKPVPGELRDFDWDSKSLVFTMAGDGSVQPVRAEDLGFWSKVRLLSSPAFCDRMLNHLADLEKNPGYRSGMEKLQKAGLSFVGTYVFLFCAMNWLLAGWILRSGSILRWLESVAAFVVLCALCGSLVVVCNRQGSHQVLEYVGFAALLHTVLYLFLVWVIYHSAPWHRVLWVWRPVVWYGLSWMVALSLPVSLGGTALMAQVHRHAGTLDLGAWDGYLTEVWLRPMGLL